MSVLTDKQKKKAISLSQRGTQLRWEWGDWAVEVCGPVGEGAYHDGSFETLMNAKAEITASNEVITLPSIERLRDYRYAADAIPPKLREAVPSIEAGRILGQKVKDRLELHETIEALKNEKGIVTVDAVREHFDHAQTNTGRMRLSPAEPSYDPPMPLDEAGQVRMARKLLEKPEIAKKVIATPGKAGNIVEQEVERKRAQERRAREAARAERDQREALPISAYENRILERYINIAGEVASSALPFDELSPVGAERIGDALDHIADNARATAKKCRNKPNGDDDDVIEGKVVSLRRELSA